MPLPQQVINQLSQEPTPETPGWSSGVLMFSAVLFAFVLVVYLGIAFAYEPYLNAKVSNIDGQISKVGQSISSADSAQLITFYSQVSNLKSLLASHVLFSKFFEWMSSNTETNVYYSAFSFSSGDQVTLTGIARTEADINQQLAVFSGSPDVQHFTVTNISSAPTAGGWQFAVTLIMNPALFTASQS